MKLFKNIKGRGRTIRDGQGSGSEPPSSNLNSHTAGGPSLSSQTLGKNSHSTQARDRDAPALPLDLWDRAYKELCKKDKKLVQEYERVSSRIDSRYPAGRWRYLTHLASSYC
jgi:hypothetical protein